MKLPLSYTPLSLSEVHRRRAARPMFRVAPATPDVAVATRNEQGEDEEVGG